MCCPVSLHNQVLATHPNFISIPSLSSRPSPLFAASPKRKFLAFLKSLPLGQFLGKTTLISLIHLKSVTGITVHIRHYQKCSAKADICFLGKVRCQCFQIPVFTNPSSKNKMEWTSECDDSASKGQMCWCPELIPGTHVKLEGQTHSTRLHFDLYMCTVASTHTIKHLT